MQNNPTHQALTRLKNSIILVYRILKKQFIHSNSLTQVRHSLLFFISFLSIILYRLSWLGKDAKSEGSDE